MDFNVCLASVEDPDSDSTTAVLQTTGAEILNVDEEAVGSRVEINKRERRVASAPRPRRGSSVGALRSPRLLVAGRRRTTRAVSAAPDRRGAPLDDPHKDHSVDPVRSTQVTLTVVSGCGDDSRRRLNDDDQVLASYVARVDDVTAATAAINSVSPSAFDAMLKQNDQDAGSTAFDNVQTQSICPGPWCGVFVSYAPTAAEMAPSYRGRAGFDARGSRRRRGRGGSSGHRRGWGVLLVRVPSAGRRGRGDRGSSAGASARRRRGRGARRRHGRGAQRRAPPRPGQARLVRAPPPQPGRAEIVGHHRQRSSGAAARDRQGRRRRGTRTDRPRGLDPDSPRTARVLPRGATRWIVRDGRAPRRYAPTQPETLYQPSAQPTVAPTTETAAPSVTPVPTASKASALVGVINVIGLTLDNCIATKPIFASGIAGISAKIKL